MFIIYYFQKTFDILELLPKCIQKLKDVKKSYKFPSNFIFSVGESENFLSIQRKFLEYLQVSIFC